MSKLKLNLGCGNKKLPDYLNVDKFGTPDLQVDLESFPWPWEDNSVQEVLLEHVLEHLGETTATYLNLIQELYRVCQHDAKILIRVPHPRHNDFINDPTHVRAITPESLSLLSKKQNDYWKANNCANTQLAYHLGVDFEVGQPQFMLDPYWASKLQNKEITERDLDEKALLYNNVIKEIKIELRAIKD